MKYLKLMLFTVLTVIFTCIPVFAQDSSVMLPPDWAVPILQAVLKLPYIGPYLIIALKWVTIIGAIFTSLSVAVGSISMTLRTLASITGLDKVADWVKNVNDKVQPWLKWLSFFNSEKPTETIKASITGK